MNLLRIFQKKSKAFYVLLLSLGITNSVLYSGLLVIINNTITGTALPFCPPQYSWVAFGAVIAAAIAVSRIFQSYMIRLSREILLDFELLLLDKLRSASYQSYEQIGPERVYAAIGDTKAIGQVPELLMGAINAGITVLCGLGYLCWLSPVGGAGVLLTMLLLLAVYLVRNKSIARDLNRLRDLQNDYYKYLKDLLFGFREIRMSSQRSENIFTRYLKKNRLDEYHYGVDTSIRYLNNELLGRFSWYIIIGLILFALPVLYTSLNAPQVTAFVVTILYIIGPVAMLIVLGPHYTRINIALQRLEGLERQICDNVDTDLPVPGPAAGETEEAELESIRFEDVTFEYHNRQHDTTFQLGPINLEVTRGELLFVTGGNGSGKSTFINLLTGLYKPTGGTIYWNGQPISGSGYNALTDRISAVFTSNYLFNENYDGFDLRSSNRQLQYYLKMMELNRVVQPDDEANRLGNQLSKGQQKRLALIYVMLEERPIIVLDEWAAEQDPHFRAYFYKVILAELRRMGKTVIAVTHDDMYFNCADRMLRFDCGKIIDQEELVLHKE